MIADERVHVAARFGRLLFQVHQQVHGAARFGTAVHHVAHLHEMGFASGPRVLLIDHAGGAQQRDELLVIPVHVAQGNDALHAAPGVLSGERDAGPKKQEEKWHSPPV